MRIDVVGLCDQFDIAAHFRDVLAERHPHIRMLTAVEVSDPATIRHAVVFRPGPEAFAPYPNLSLVCIAAAGIDGVVNHPGLRPEMTVMRIVSPAQGRMMSAFAAHYVTGWHRRMWDYPVQQAERIWAWADTTPPRDFPVGVLGFGEIGQRIAAGLTALGYPVTALARSPRAEADVDVVAGRAGLMRIARDCRAIVNVLPLTAATAGILDARFFGSMGADTMLIHLGRGPHLVEADLLDGLARGRPARAAIDVFDQEPPPASHPFWAHPDIMVTPHVAGFAPKDEAVDILADAIARFGRGEFVPGRVTPDRGY